jgi:hypothetical protein
MSKNIKDAKNSAAFHLPQMSTTSKIPKTVLRFICHKCLRTSMMPKQCCVAFATDNNMENPNHAKLTQAKQSCLNEI